ncbi:hypothetical protein HYH03_004603 [Edaphochlamys debaryana]|uniref:indole-3-pyruvate monooxygenase n=1 Tax=Edaphochlamys debaryana TaxID=47281 RepID=A0A835Y7F8_9CHLO|nr:hypothetical protein HYH03_004602 [Edaphochlamys debaryana]KAG2497448.1 hypothetical protein HYH03_004603 [Edaphochlamys debaryana]|eukprot:KAG2497447.1 hypothetical protein HYH03_004602 [Edaphochlamys debaryana]
MIGSGLAKLEAEVKDSLAKLNYPGKPWVKNHSAPDGSHCYDVVIVGGGQCGLTTAFGLAREQVENVVVLDENPAGLEGPWVTYARMVTLRTNKALTGPDLGVPALTFQSYFEAKYGTAAWEKLDKIPRGEWMDYLIWYRRVLGIPVRNSAKVDVIRPLDTSGPGTMFEVALVDPSSGETDTIYTRKVVLATGIQGGGEWHVPGFIKACVPAAKYAHTSQDIDFEALRGKRVAILGGGASAFDNAQYGLERGVGEVHVFVRRPELPRINPIRHMEFAGFLRHFSDLDDATKYAGIDFFLQFNQPPTNCTFARAARFPNFHLHTGAPWERLEMEGDRVRVTTPQGSELFDFLIVSTGLLTDTKLRPELREVSAHIATWADRYTPPPPQRRNPLIDAHPYLGPGFEFTPKEPGTADYLRGIFAYNYSALVSLGLSASALSGMKFAMGKLVTGITKQLFLDDKDAFIGEYLSYDVEEFKGVWPLPAAPVAAPAPAASVAAGAACGSAAPECSVPACAEGSTLVTAQ